MTAFSVFRLLCLYIHLIWVSAGWFTAEEVDSPIVLWWTPFTGELGNLKTCGEHTCFFTENRTYIADPKVKVVVFYGSSFSLVDLPLPRKPEHDWALLHEESPKNNPSFCHQSLISLFNFTSTWSRHSSFPLTLLSLPKLDDLIDQSFYVPTKQKNALQAKEGLAPVVYVQSSCDAPLERDAYVSELQKFIHVDSYGKCLNNKPLPGHLADAAESMNDEEFLRLIANYKFTLSFENAVGNDYVTEKLWRPLIVGSVPVYLGSPTVKDWIPNDNSIVSVLDFESPETLAELLHSLNGNDRAYNEMLRHKTSGIVTNRQLVGAFNRRKWTPAVEEYDDQNFVEAYECFLCSEIHRKQSTDASGHSASTRAPVDGAHFNCPEPVHPVTRRRNPENWWLDHWHQSAIEAEVVRQFALRNQNFTADEFYGAVAQRIARSDSSRFE